ncbi:pentatricopeptide repeat-containing protein 2, mitochondrial-like isoform X2 [Odontomachus brunneus]|nr:pentatricopeptide repeat-containing protein 2, mitochondrial-like isoform X2 [Odontomachus brunneus]
MAATMRGLMKLNVTLASNTLLRSSLLNSCRFLYSDQALGIVNYEAARLNFRNQFINVEDTFRSKMQEVCNTESSMIFTEDLKSMLHLVQKKPEDIELIVKMLTKFNIQNKEMRFGNFIFGPVVMRTFYYLDEPDLALTAFKDPQFDNFFNQFMSYQILLCLLYKHNRYSDIKEVFEIIKIKNATNNMFPKNSITMVMAACYKENTAESIEYALSIWKEFINDEYYVRRATSLLAALAINQNMAHIAIEIITTIRQARYIDVRCLKVAAYTNLKRFTEIVPIFRTSLDQDKPNNQKECYFKDVIENLEYAMEKENIAKDFELYKLLALLKNNNRILPDTLQNHLTTEIKYELKRGPRTMNQETRTNNNVYLQRQQLTPTRKPMLRNLL